MSEDFLGAILAGQSIGIPMTSIRDVLGLQSLTPVPLAPCGVLGLLNLRGRVVTAVDLRARLDVPVVETVAEPVFIIVDAGGELYALRVDAVTDVTTVAPGEVEPVPAHLAPAWHAAVDAVYPTRTRASERSLMALLKLEKLFGAGLFALQAGLPKAS